MPAIHIRDVPEETVRVLRERAERHNRSMQQELRLILADAAAESPQPRIVEPLRLTTTRSGHSETFTREDIYAGADGAR